MTLKLAFETASNIACYNMLTQFLTLLIIKITCLKQLIYGLVISITYLSPFHLKLKTCLRINFYLKWFLCNSGIRTPNIAPSPSPTATSDGKCSNAFTRTYPSNNGGTSAAAYTRYLVDPKSG